MKIKDVDVVVALAVCGSEEEALKSLESLEEQDSAIMPEELSSSLVIDSHNDGNQVPYSAIIEIENTIVYGKGIIVIGGQFIPVANVQGTIVTTDVDGDEEVREALCRISEIEYEGEKKTAIAELKSLLTESGKEEVSAIAGSDDPLSEVARLVDEAISAE